MKAALDKLGPVGQKAVEQLTLRAGATPRAQMLLNDAWYKIYDGLETTGTTEFQGFGKKIKNERDLFDRFAIAHRIIAIDKGRLGKRTKTGKKAEPTFHGGTTGRKHAEWLRGFKQQLGEERFAEFSKRAEEYFNVMDSQLEALYSNQLISPIEYRRMKGTNYLTTRHLEFIDPQYLHKELGGKVISVADSGLHPFKGSKKAQTL